MFAGWECVVEHLEIDVVPTLFIMESDKEEADLSSLHTKFLCKLADELEKHNPESQCDEREREGKREKETC